MPDPVALKAVFRVIDAHDHPHGGRIFRLRLGKGEAPRVRELRGREVVATSESGDTAKLKVSGFSAAGGRPSDGRLARTGRIDVHVAGDGAGSVDVGWELAVSG